MGLACGAQQGTSRPAREAVEAATDLSAAPRTWAVECGTQEVQLIEHPGSYLRYRMHVVDERGDTVRDQIETPGGSVARLILREGRALTPEQDTAERERLTALLNSPAAFARHIHNEQTNKKLGADMIKLMPDAMLWSYAPGQPQPAWSSAKAAAANGQLVVLDFKPNPNWSAPTMAAQALTGLQGRIWIDRETHQMVRLEGTVVRAVNVGWGVVAHLYPGGTITLEQTHVSGERWIASHIVERLVVRALMVKTIRQEMVYDTADYQPIQPVTYQQAIRMLLETPLPAH
ncbi:MAG: hypothetical protein M3O02_12005 [Acidobacteriota bacterium]|nr:hypothetical protein [Acidobacteriota bacterium]